MALTCPLTWPTSLLPPVTPRAVLQTQSRSGGQATTGAEQIVRSPAARWAISFANIAVYTKAQILAWLAIAAALDGRAGTILVPLYDWIRSPAGRWLQASFDDGSTFDDGALFRGWATNITLQQDVAANATQIAASWIGPPPGVGQHFSIGSGAQTELHRVVSLDQSSDTAGTLTIRPWTRAAWPAGTRLEFDEPHCCCRLASDDAMKLDLELWRLANPSVDFVEAF